MAKRNHTRDLRTPTTDDPAQRLTVSFYQDDNPDTLWIKLCGAGLEQAGFSPLTPVQVRIMRGCLLVTRA
ncbi:SymE family type I addiction module toxin [Collimonas pratensis]|uniref:SymE family type I addiction module toxin n=1 Tax=Collimonas pratensis TaxID=279113 RepID=UPI0007839A84|nr:SymE family type I addiction module toxin [Collimonas pratensis]NKI71775.1 type I addiction module toxin, SymE family [Collimonas pratensis]